MDNFCIVKPNIEQIIYYYVRFQYYLLSIIIENEIEFTNLPTWITVN